jgi:hypothetical protein
VEGCGEGHRLLEGGRARRPPQRPEYGSTGDEHEDRGGDGAPDVPAQAGGEGEQDEPVEVLEHGCPATNDSSPLIPVVNDQNDRFSRSP